MKHTLSTAILTILLAGSVMASESQNIQNAQQLNSLPPEIQARVHVMMGAKKVETRIKDDGTKADVYQIPDPSESHKKALQDRYANNQMNTKDPSVPLAEAAMAAPPNIEKLSKPSYDSNPVLKRYVSRIEDYRIDGLAGLKAAPFQKEKEAIINLTITNGLSFITHFDEFFPYLQKVTAVNLLFTDAQERDPNFANLLHAFAQKANPHLVYTLKKDSPSFSLRLHLRRDTLLTFGPLSDSPGLEDFDPIVRKMGFTGTRVSIEVR